MLARIITGDRMVTATTNGTSFFLSVAQHDKVAPMIIFFHKQARVDKS